MCSKKKKTTRRKQILVLTRDLPLNTLCKVTITHTNANKMKTNGELVEIDKEPVLLYVYRVYNR